MNRRLLLFWMIVFLIFLSSRSASAFPGTDSCALPPRLQTVLQTKYPGTHVLSLSDLSDYDREEFPKYYGSGCPGLVKVNFYGDGKPTVAVVLVSGMNPKRKASLVVATRGVHGWQTRLLETTNGSPIVTRQKPGKYQSFDGEKSIRARYPAIVFVGIGSWAIVYAWIGNRVESVQTSD